MIIDHIRNLKEFVRFYHKYKMPNQYDLKWLINNPNLFCFYSVDNILYGYITVQKENGLLTLSGASIRKNMAENIKFIKMVCDAFEEDMYAFTRVRPAQILLLKAGFKKVDNNKYVRLKRNGKI